MCSMWVRTRTMFACVLLMPLARASVGGSANAYYGPSALPRSGSSLRTWPSNLSSSRLRYDHRNGIYWSTYGGPLQKATVDNVELGLLDDVLAFEYVAGVAHYQNWSTLETSQVLTTFGRYIPRTL